MLYGQFRGAAVGRSVLPAPAIYLSKRPKAHLRSDTVMLASMAMQFDYIKKEAKDNHLLEWSEGQMHDVPNRSSSPYGQDTCFVLTALKQKVKGLSLNYLLPEELMFTNLAKGVDRIQIDFDNGEGFKAYRIGGIEKVNYSSSGRKSILLQYQYDGRTIIMTTFVEVEEVELKLTGGPESGMPYQKNSPEEISLAGVDLSIFSACEDGKVRRPLIVVEGFGGEFTNTAKLFALLSKTTSTEIPLEDWLNEREYDLIWVDYKNPYASISDNANYVIQAIEWINARKHADGSNEPNVLLGASMGGVVNKLALLRMHNEQGKDAEVERFFSFDAPLQGANYPIGVQAFLVDLIDQASNIGASTASLDDAFQLLNSPAAVDLLKARVLLNPPSSSESCNSFSLAPPPALFDYIDGLEAIRPLNNITRHIALSNGSDFGNLQESIGIIWKIMELRVELEEVSGQGVWQGCYDVIIDAEAYVATGTSTLVYARSIALEVTLICEPFGNDETDYICFELPEPMNLDDAPGGTSDLALSALGVGLESLITSLGDDVEASSSHVYLNSFSFVPTVSALDMPPETNPVTTSPVGGQAVARWITSIDNSVVSPYTGNSEFNQEHVSMNVRIADLLTEELEPPVMGGVVSPLISGAVYNFGREVPVDNNTPPTETPRVITEDITIQSGAELWINRNDLIGDISSSILQNNNQQQFAVRVPGTNCEDDVPAVDVTVEEGGKITVGDYDNDILNIGQLHFGKNSQLVVNGSDGVEVDKYSKLAIGPGATMTINSGGKVQANAFSNILVQNNGRVHIKSGSTLRLIEEAQLIVEEGGTLEIDAGANIDLWWLESSIHIKSGGELIINGTFNLVGSGFFQFDQGNTLTLNAPFELTGNGKTSRFIRLNEEATLDISNGTLDWKHGKVEYMNYSKVSIGQGGQAIINHITFEGVGPNQSNTATALQINRASNIDILDGSFYNLDTGIDVFGMNQSSHNFKTQLADFKNCFIGVFAESCKFLDIAGYFTPNDDSFAAISLWNVEKVDFHGSSDGYSSTGAINIYNDAEAATEGLQEFTQLNVKGASISNNQVGIRIDDFSGADIILTNGANLDYNFIGIDARGSIDNPESALANVTVNRGSSVSYNDTGIFIGRGQEFTSSVGKKRYFNVVEMSCAKMIDNMYGVKGKDIFLNIDACLVSGQPVNDCDYSLTSPSHFKNLGPGNIFAICYEYVNDPTIDATGNYWESGQPSVTPFQVAIGNDFSGSYGCSGSTFNDSNPATVNDLENCKPGGVIVIDIPQIPPPNETSFTDCDPDGLSVTCLYSDGTTNNLKMNAQFNHAYADYVEEDYTNSSAKYLELANISDTDKAALCEPCQHYINVARSRTFYGPGAPDAAFAAQIDNNISQSKSATQKTNISSLDVNIFPNPTSGELNIKTNSEQSLIRIIDIHGRVKMTLKDGLDYQINTQSWATGIYIVEIMDRFTMEVLQQKVVVQP